VTTELFAFGLLFAVVSIINNLYVASTDKTKRTRRYTAHIEYGCGMLLFYVALPIPTSVEWTGMFVVIMATGYAGMVLVSRQVATKIDIPFHIIKPTETK
jgi:uncharacterized membrane protein